MKDNYIILENIEDMSIEKLIAQLQFYKERGMKHVSLSTHTDIKNNVVPELIFTRKPIGQKHKKLQKNFRKNFENLDDCNRTPQNTPYVGGEG